MKTLQDYTNKLIELNLFKKNNAKIFLDLENLENNLNEAELKLKEKVRETRLDIANKSVKVTVSERYNKYYDFTLFMKLANGKEIEALDEAGGIKHEINKIKFKECFDDGKISNKTRLAIYKEELGSVAVTIKKLI